jgi:hypothetical protein
VKKFAVGLLLFLACSANSSELIVRVVEDGVKDAKDIKLPITKEQVAWENFGWKCTSLAIAKTWGTFRCKRADGLEVSTRFNCDRHKSFDESRSFRIAKSAELNATFSIWCK